MGDPGDSRPILLLGAGGQLGRALAARLGALGALVAATRAEADLEHLDSLRAVIRATRPSLVVNAAAYTAVDAAEHDAERCLRVNGDAPGIIAEESARLRVPMVHFSTNYVFDGTATGPYREDVPTSPLNVYGRSKALGELAVAGGNSAHFIFRLAGVYGWRGRNFLRRILDLGREREELRVVDDQLGAPTPASAVADAVVRVLQVRAGAWDHVSSGTYHLTCAGAVSWFHFAEEILALDPLRTKQRVRRVTPIRSEEMPAVARRPLNGLLDNEKFAREFGFALPGWEVELRRTIAEHVHES